MLRTHRCSFHQLMAARARTSLHFKSATSVGEIKILLMLTWNKVNEPSTTPKTGGRQKKKISFIIYLSHRGENEDCGTHTPPCPEGANYKSFNDIIVVIPRTLRKRLSLSVRNCTTNRGQMNSFIQRHLFLKYKQQMTRQEKIRQQESISGLFFSRLWISDARKEREEGEKKTNNNRIRIAIESTDFGKRKQQHFQR